VDITDGIVDRGRFEGILWLLREAHVKRGPLEDLAEGLLGLAEAGRFHGTWVRTYGLVAKVSHGLLNPGEPWESWQDTATYISSLAKIAVINVKKTGGGRRVVPSEIAAAASAGQERLRRQVREIAPRIVILGGTAEVLADWFPGQSNTCAESDHFGSWRQDGAIWVSAYHPQQTAQGHRPYFDNVRNAIDQA
jgi:hypothetical protein